MQPLNKNLKNTIYINDQSVLIGHSCGAAFLVRWLGEHDRKIAKLILVTPRKVRSKRGESIKTQESDLYDFDINPEITKRVGKIIMFTSDNSVQEGKESLQQYYEVLWGTVIELPQHGHYTLKDMWTEAFPELLEKIFE